MNQKDLINGINQKLSATFGPNEERVKATLKALAEVATAELKTGGEVSFPGGLGKLVVEPTAARAGRNPRTGAAIQIPAGRKAKFTAGKELKDALKG
jgi:nucleoid DNA-binding protein